MVFGERVLVKHCHAQLRDDNETPVPRRRLQSTSPGLPPTAFGDLHPQHMLLRFRCRGLSGSSGVKR
jgi:hypothetical protein